MVMITVQSGGQEPIFWDFLKTKPSKSIRFGLGHQEQARDLYCGSNGVFPILC